MASFLACLFKFELFFFQAFISYPCKLIILIHILIKLVCFHKLLLTMFRVIIYSLLGHFINSIELVNCSPFLLLSFWRNTSSTTLSPTIIFTFSEHAELAMI